MRNQYKVLSEKYIAIKENEKEDILGGLDSAIELNNIIQPVIDQGKEFNRKHVLSWTGEIDSATLNDEMEDWYDKVINQFKVYINPVFSGAKKAKIKNSVRHVLYYYTTDSLNAGDQELFEELIYAMFSDLITYNDLTEAYWSVYDSVKTQLELDKI